MKVISALLPSVRSDTVSNPLMTAKFEKQSLTEALTAGLSSSLPFPSLDALQLGIAQ